MVVWSPWLYWVDAGQNGWSDVSVELPRSWWLCWMSAEGQFPELYAGGFLSIGDRDMKSVSRSIVSNSATL